MVSSCSSPTTPSHSSDTGNVVGWNRKPPLAVAVLAKPLLSILLLAFAGALPQRAVADDAPQLPATIIKSLTGDTIVEPDGSYTTISHVFFVQAEDGIRDGTVTGVQTCALPI